MRLVSRVAWWVMLAGACWGCGSSEPPAVGSGVAGSSSSSGDGSGASAGSGSNVGGRGDDGSGDEAGAAGSGGAASGQVGTRCDVEVPFETEGLLAALDSPSGSGARLTSDELTIVFERDDDIYIAERSSRAADFGTPQLLDFGIAGQKRAPWISEDRQTLLFELDLDSIYISHRSGGVFAAATLVASPAADPFVVGGANGRLYFIEAGDLMMVPLDNWDPSDAPSWIEISNSGGQRPVLSADELTLYFENSDDIVQARRATVSDDFALTDLSINIGAGANLPSWLSPDHCRLYADVGRSLYLLERSPSKP